MYTYNKNDKSYTFSTDDLDIDKIVEQEVLISEDISQSNNENSENNDTNTSSSNEDQTIKEVSNEENKPRKIEVINGGNDLDISPVTNYIEVEKPKNEKKENIVIPKNNK